MHLNDLVPFRHRRNKLSVTDEDSPFERMHAEMDRLFSDFLPQFTGARGANANNGLLASIDVSETDSALEVKADLPSMEEKDIDVTLQDGVLRIRGERKLENEEQTKNFYRAERTYGSFQRTITLPCSVDEEKIDAQFRRGVLTIKLPKSPEAVQNAKKIAVKAA